MYSQSWCLEYGSLASAEYYLADKGKKSRGVFYNLVRQLSKAVANKEPKPAFHPTPTNSNKNQGCTLSSVKDLILYLFMLAEQGFSK